MTEHDALHRATVIERALTAILGAEKARAAAEQQLEQHRTGIAAAAAGAEAWELDTNGHVTVGEKVIGWCTATEVAAALATIAECEKRILEAREALTLHGIDPAIIARALTQG